MSTEAQLTPMMAQYRRIKGELPKDALLLFRLGDFYEMFFEDAQAGSQLLNLSLTARNGIPMCGLPYHAANGYIARILKAGRKVAVRDSLRGSFQILSGYDDWTFAPETALYTVRDHFKVASLDGFGLKDRAAAIGAAGGALHYLTQNLRRDVKHLTRLSFYRRTDFLALDYTTLRHLEILEPLHRDAPRNSSLLGALNKTVTPMGARLLRSWLSQPLAAVEPIARRQEAVGTFIENSAPLES